MKPAGPDAPATGAPATSPEVSRQEDDTPWREPDDLDFGARQRLSEVGDRRLRDLRANEPRLGGAWVKLSFMIVALVGILIFHSEMSDRAAGCYKSAAGLEDTTPPPAAAPAARQPTTGTEVQFRIERADPPR